MSAPIYQDEYFVGTSEEVFDILAVSEHHAAATGAPAHIELRSGGAYSAYGGALEGSVLEFERPRRLVLDWRGREWPNGQSSTVTFELDAIDDRTAVVHLTHESLSDDHYEPCSRGWGSSYWSKMHAYLQERRKSVVAAFVERYKNQQDWDSVDDFVAEDCTVHIPLPGLPQGREGMRVNGKLMCTAFPDVHVTRAFFCCDGDIVIERADAKATHKAELIGVPATNRPVTWTELHAYRVRGSEITEVWSEADFMGVMVQIGAVEMPSP